MAPDSSNSKKFPIWLARFLASYNSGRASGSPSSPNPISSASTAPGTFSETKPNVAASPLLSGEAASSPSNEASIQQSSQPSSQPDTVAGPVLSDPASPQQAHDATKRPKVIPPPITASPSHALRLSMLPKTITEKQLRQYLNSLECENQGLDVADNVLALSLAPYIDWLVATVTFRREPSVFAQCKKRHSMELRMPFELKTVAITVDRDFYGITPLYHPDGPEFDIVAVSGLASHAFGSWKSRGPSQPHLMWLRDLLPLDFPKFRILTWGYDSDLHDSITTQSIMDFSRQLLTAVHGARDGSEVEITRPIVFIGHSLGGLVIKQALVDAAQGSSENDKFILQACVGLFLFGVPNRGLNSKNLESLVKGKKNAPFVAGLREGSDLLRQLHVAFLRSYVTSLKPCFVASFYETKDTMTVKEIPGGIWERTEPAIRMVTFDSATTFMPQEEIHNQIAIDADHSNIVKFDGRADRHYLAVRSKFREMVKMAAKTRGKRTNSSMYMNPGL